ncbi:MAG TPA: hypothetical protein PK530_16575, partial [Anaerolineales bacterium]|nr:hypothetical protein [Anaerolineales bacterium]
VCVHPKQFVFTCAKDKFELSIPTFVYIDNSLEKSYLLGIGEEWPNDQPLKPEVYRIDIFEYKQPLPPKTTFSRYDLLEAIIAYGIGKTLEKTFYPVLRPIVFILDADQLNGVLINPREKLLTAAKGGGAITVIFDRTEIE